jgi:hypothetical protein
LGHREKYGEKKAVIFFITGSLMAVWRCLTTVQAARTQAEELKPVQVWEKRKAAETHIMLT